MSGIGRAWATLGLTRNPMRRRTDRAEARMSIALGLALITGVMALAWGTGSAVWRTTDPRSGNGHLPVTATVLRSTSRLASDSAYSVTVSAHARWIAPTGFLREGVISVPRGTKPGTTTPIWIDRAGALTERPLTSADRAVTAMIIAMLTAGAWIIVVAAGWLVGRHRLDQLRYADWEREWVDVEPQWCQY